MTFEQISSFQLVASWKQFYNNRLVCLIRNILLNLSLDIQHARKVIILNFIIKPFAESGKLNYWGVE